MELAAALRTRRSIRRYTEEQIPDQTLLDLLDLAVWAPSGMNGQPWVFAVVQDKAYMRRLSDQAKAFMLTGLKDHPKLERYRRIMTNPDFNLFYNAPTLVLIYGDTQALTYRYDCSLAALNLMLAAWDRGLGSCWIGFATATCDTPAVKEKLSVPPAYQAVAPVILGYPQTVPSRGKREAPRIVSWLKPKNPEA
ncbi:MAG: nitroreductase family protein [Bacillota bacterium]|jgi:nitroreductase